MGWDDKIWLGGRDKGCKCKRFHERAKKSVKLLVLHSNEGPEKTVEQM